MFQSFGDELRKGVANAIFVSCPQRATLAILLTIAAWAACATPVFADPAPPAPAAPASAPATPLAGVVAADTGFGITLLGLLQTEAPGANVFISPISISTCLAVAMNGAGGQTYDDMANSMGLSAFDLPTINQAYGALLPQLAGADPAVQVSIADALRIRPQLSFSPDFQARCKQFYTADTSAVDFRSPTAADTINAWVSQRTQGKIASLVQQSDVSAADVILTNAVYFHGEWTQPFDTRATKPAAFTTASGATTNVAMMAQTGSYLYFEDSGIQAVCLPYGSGRLGLWVLLPKGDPAAWLQKLDPPTLQQILSGASQTEVAVKLPRFDSQYRASLKDPLSKLGMGRTFGDNDFNFGPMGLPADFIDDVIHETVISVDETGTTAAAATGTTMTRSVMRQAKTMTVDHPFFCAVRDSVTGAILFAGMIDNPASVPAATP